MGVVYCKREFDEDVLIAKAGLLEAVHPGQHLSHDLHSGMHILTSQW